MKHQATGVIQGVRGEHLREALGSDPSSLAFVGLAHISYQDGDHEGAISICREGLNYHPNHSTAHLILGLALAGAGNKRESIRALQEVIKLDPGNRLANRHLGEMRRKKPDKIPEQVTPMPLPDEEPEETHIGDEIAFFTFSMAEVYQRQGFFEKALAIYQRVLTLQPQREDVRERIETLKRKIHSA